MLNSFELNLIVIAFECRSSVIVFVILQTHIHVIWFVWLIKISWSILSLRFVQPLIQFNLLTWLIVLMDFLNSFCLSGLSSRCHWPLSVTILLVEPSASTPVTQIWKSHNGNIDCNFLISCISWSTFPRLGFHKWQPIAWHARHSPGINLDENLENCNG